MKISRIFLVSGSVLLEVIHFKNIWTSNFLISRDSFIIFAATNSRRCLSIADLKQIGFKIKDGPHDVVTRKQNLRDVLVHLTRTVEELRGRIDGNEELRKKRKRTDRSRGGLIKEGELALSVSWLRWPNVNGNKKWQACWMAHNCTVHLPPNFPYSRTFCWLWSRRGAMCMSSEHQTSRWTIPPIPTWSWRPTSWVAQTVRWWKDYCCTHAHIPGWLCTWCTSSGQANCKAGSMVRHPVTVLSRTRRIWSNTPIPWNGANVFLSCTSMMRARVTGTIKWTLALTFYFVKIHPFLTQNTFESLRHYLNDRLLLFQISSVF